MTHKIGRIKDYLSYQQLPQQDEMGQKLTEPQPRRQRRSSYQNDSYDIYGSFLTGGSKGHDCRFLSRSGNLSNPRRFKLILREIDQTFTFYEFALPLHQRIRTSNLLERLERRVSAQVVIYGLRVGRLCLSLCAREGKPRDWVDSS